MPRYTSHTYQQLSLLHQPPIGQTSLNITILLKSKMAAILLVTLYTSHSDQQHSLSHQPSICQTSQDITILLKSKMAAILLVAPIYLTPIPTTFPFTPTTYLSNISQYDNFTEIQDGDHFVG